MATKNTSKTKKPKTIAVKGGITGLGDQENVADTYSRAFSDRSWMERHLFECLFQPPIYDPEHTRIVKVDGEIVSGVTMAPRMMRFGPVSVPSMTIGPVGTHDRHRKQGYASVAMEDACAYMKENGILVAYLQGIRDFYHRFGFYPYMAPGRIKIKRKHAAKIDGSGKLRAMKKSDIPAVRRIFNSVNASRIGPAVRSKQVWDWLFDAGSHTWLFKKPMVILDESGTVCGYLTGANDSDSRFGEIVVKQSDSACRVALGAITRYAKRLEWAEINLPIPWNDPFSVFLRQHVPVETVLQSGATGGALMKIVDFPELMRRLEPLLNARWCGSPLGEYDMNIVSDIGTVGLHLDSTGLSIESAIPSRETKRPRSKTVNISSRWLSGLVSGYYAVHDILQRDGVSIPRECIEPLARIFPTGWPFVYQGDNY